MTVDAVPLKRVAAIRPGQSPSSDDVRDYVSGVPFLQGNAEFGKEYPIPRFECETARKHCFPGDILVSVRAPVGALNVADRVYAIGRGLCAVSARDCDPRFLWWWLHDQIDRLKSVATGSTYEAVSADDLGALEFPRINAEEQRRIADFLDGEINWIDRIVELRRAQDSLLHDRFQALRDRWVGALYEKNGSIPLRRLMRSIEQGFSPQCDAVAADDEEWGVLKLSSVKSGRFIPGENKRLPDEELGTPVVSHGVRLGDLLVTRANTPDLVGDVAVVDVVGRFLLPDLIYRVNLNIDVDARYIAQVALCTRVRGMVSAQARGSSQSMVKLRGEDIREWPIPPAPMVEQLSFIDQIERAGSRVADLRSALARQVSVLAERKQALITAAVTGQIDVTTAREAEAP